MRDYEGMFLLDPVKSGTDWDNVKSQVDAMLERNKGVQISSKKWAEKKLAYEIKGHKRGTYLLMYFQMPPEMITSLRRDLQFSEVVLRALILANPKRPVAEEAPVGENKPAEIGETPIVPIAPIVPDVPAAKSPGPPAV